jgi:hypothetical protein
MDAVADAVGNEVEKPPFYYAEQSQQNKFECAACGELTDILGRFGYCSYCATRNDFAEIEKSIDQVRERIKTGGPFEACVRDAVSAFDSFAGNYAAELVRLVPMTPQRRGAVEGMRFHALRPAANLYSKVFDIDLFSKLSPDDVAFAERMFHRRHVYEHNGGEADDKYIQDSGDTSVKPKQVLRETGESAHRIASLVLRIGSILHHGFHEIIKPDQKWIANSPKARRTIK